MSGSVTFLTLEQIEQLTLAAAEGTVSKDQVIRFFRAHAGA